MKFNNETIRVAVREWIEDENKAKEKYGDINDWDTSEVTDMSKLFLDAHEFNSPIGSWDVSNVKTMHAMFDNAFKFDQNINNWDVSNVEDMSEMFSTTQELDFNQPLGNWDVGSVKRMNSMFYNAKLFNHDLSKWNVSNVTNMRGMFDSAKSFNQAIGEWDVSSVKSMNWMFRNAISFNEDIGKWNVSNVVEMSEMFRNAKSFNKAIGEWDVSSVKSMEGMFANAESFTHSLEKWNLKNGISLKELFKDPTLNQLLEGLNDLTDDLLNSPNFQSRDTKDALIDLKNKLNNQKESPEKTDVYNESQMEIQRFYFDTGELECEQEVDSNEILNGFVRYYHKNGNLQTEVFWKDGKQLDGQVDSYDEEGNLVRSVYIKNGTQNGEFEEYYPNKKIKRKGVYKNGVIVEEILFDNNGNKTIIQLYNKVFSNSEFKQKLNEFKRKNNDICSFEGITLDLNKWGLYKKGYILGSFQGHNFIKTSEIGVKWAIDDEYWDEICSYDEGEFLDFIGNEELNQFFLESEDFESGEVTSVIWNEGVPKDVVNKSRENSFFHNPWFLYYGNPCEPDHPIYELESDTIRTPGKDTIVNSVVLKLRGENYNSTLEWCFSIDKVSESAERVSKSQSNKLIKDGFIGILTKLIIKVTDSEGIDDLLKNVKVKGNSLIKEFEKNSEQLIISFNVLMEMFYDIRLATESIGDIYDLIGSENKDISEIRFQLFTEMRVNFSIDKLFNGCLCVLIILFYSSLTENQKN